MTTLLMTAAEAAFELRVGRSTIDNLVQQGVLQPLRIGRSLRLRRLDIEAFVDGLTGQAAPGRPRSRLAAPEALGKGGVAQQSCGLIKR